MKKLWLLTILIMCTAFATFGANVTVPELELYTRAYLEGGNLLVATRGNVDLLIDGGYKFGGRIILGFESYDLEDLAGDRSVVFKGAYIVVREMLGLPLYLTYFTGEQQTFLTGDEFPELYGSKPIASRYRGYLYFPDPTQVEYDGVYTVDGTGFRFETVGLTTWMDFAVYLYQDAYLGSGYYSSDAWAIFNWEKFKMEAFLGASFPSASVGTYRGGLLLYYNAGNTGEFLAQVGVPRWDPVDDPFSIDLFYFLFEPRVNFNIMSVILTLFWHPEYYDQELTNEVGSADVNLNMQFGKEEKERAISGGLEVKTAFSISSPDQLIAEVSPYMSATTSGVIWDFKLNAKLFPFEISDMFQVFIGVHAEL